MPSKKSNDRPKASRPLEPASPLPRPAQNWSFEAIGTMWWIAIYQPLAETVFEELQQAVHDRIETFDGHYSRFRTDSLISRWAEQAGTYDLPEDAGQLFECYQQLYELTGGAVTPLIGQALSDAGYDASYSLQPQAKLAPPPAWADAMTYDVSSNSLTLIRPSLLDFGAAGKGYLVDIIAGIMESYGVSAYCIDAGGDIRFKGDSFTVGLEHPDDPKLAVGTAELGQPGRAAAICGSSGNRRSWGEYHHIINPATLKSPRHLKAVWVTAASALHADGLATALFFVEPQRLTSSFSFEYAMVHTDNSLTVSSGFPGHFFTD